MTAPATHPTETLRADLEATRAAFHALLETFSEEDFKRPSLNPGWTNGEILAHMLFGFILLLPLVPLTQLWGRLPRESSRPFARLLNAATRPFNAVNGWGARMQGRVFTHQRIGKLYDTFYARLLHIVASMPAEDWQRGMYYPTRWDANFSDFMTVEMVFRYAITHFDFHLQQVAR